MENPKRRRYRIEFADAKDPAEVAAFFDELGGADDFAPGVTAIEFDATHAPEPPEDCVLDDITEHDVQPLDDVHGDSPF